MLLRKKIYQISLVAIVFAIGSLLAMNAALAQIPPNPDEYKLEVEFEQTPLFGNEEDNFLPGDSVVRWVKVTNNTGQSQKIATEAINYFGSLNPDDVPSNDLSRALLITIRKKGSGDIYYGGGDETLFDFYKNGETYLSDIAAAVGSVNEYEFKVSFPESEGDYWQGTTTKFDIIVGFQEEDSNGIITPPSGGGGGATPGLIIKYVEVYDITDTTAKFSWFTSYNATSRVIYCEESKGCVLDLSDNLDNPPLYGYDYTTDETHTPANAKGVTYRGLDQGGIGMNEIGVTGLTPNTTYSYRAISHASPPTISRIYTFTTVALADDGDESANGSTQEYGANDYDTGDVGGAYSGIGGIVGAVSDFVDSILEGEEDKEKADEGEVAGTVDENGVEISGEAENETSGECREYPGYLLWLIILLLLIIIALLYYIYRIRKEKENKDKIV
jgi:hypothetical protein